MKKIIFSLLLVSISLFSAEQDAEAKKEQIKTEPVEEAEQFELTTLKGEKLHITTKSNGLDIKEIQGKVIFLAFFGYNCNPCRQEIPEFVKMSEKYGKDLEIIAVEVQGTQEEYLKSLVKNKNINYSVVPFNGKAKSFAYFISDKAGWKGAIPFIIVLDRTGDVKFLQTGLIPYTLLETAFNKSK